MRVVFTVVNVIVGVQEAIVEDVVGVVNPVVIAVIGDVDVSPVGSMIVHVKTIIVAHVDVVGRDNVGAAVVVYVRTFIVAHAETEADVTV